MNFSAETIFKLLQVRGVGRAKVFKLADLLSGYSPQYDDDLVDVVIEHSVSLKLPILDAKEVRASFDKGADLYEKSIEYGIRSIPFGDPLYPKLLATIPTPPVLLNAMGNYEALSQLPSIAVIGTREASTFGRAIGERIGYRLGEAGINVVSGLALGCDTAAHVGCLMSDGVTTAVLAHGLDTVYPKENKHLVNKILSSNGCVVSEYLIKTRGLPNYFVERDRIQAGLSLATVVVETGIKSGTMHTVRDTLNFGRLLAIYKHPEDKRNPKSEGNSMLLRQGDGQPLESLEDINSLISLVNPHTKNAGVVKGGTAIESIQLPVFALDEFEVVPKVKKPRAKKATKSDPPENIKDGTIRSVPNVTQTKLID